MHTILITGAAKRVGRALALRLAERGHHIAAHYHSSEADALSLQRAILDAGGMCDIFSADLAQADQVRKLIPQINERMGPLTALINNASLFQRDQQSGSRELHMRINADAPRILSESFAAQLPDDKDGVIINLTDGCHGWSMSPLFPSYAASKHELTSQTIELASRFAPRIRVVGVAPGHTIPGAEDKDGTRERLRERTPLKRSSSPEEVCDAVEFLLNAPSVTGQIIELGGGLHLLAGAKS